MDIVISFVDCKDKVWMKSYLKTIHNQSQLFPYYQFYNHNTIKYVLRGIDEFIPYVNNVFIVVSNIEQVPDYIDQSKVKIVLHKDFIPEKYLPLFNSTAIELFLHKIPGLGEEFVYFNDDMIPISHIPYEDLFKDGIPCISFNTEQRRKSPSYKQCASYRRCVLSFYEAKNTVEILTGEEIDTKDIELQIPQHSPTPLLKSVCDEASNIERHNSLLDFYITNIRSPRNLNQYYWADILYFKKQYTESNIKSHYTSTKYIKDVDIKEVKKENKFICINDYGSDEMPLSQIDDIIQLKLDTIFKNKSKYEK